MHLQDEDEQGERRCQPTWPAASSAQPSEHERQRQNAEPGIQQMDVGGREDQQSEGLKHGLAAERQCTRAVEGVDSEPPLAHQAQRTGDIAAVKIIPRVESETISNTWVGIGRLTEADGRPISHQAAHQD